MALARSAPLGKPAEVARRDSVRLGVVPVQPEQNRLISARTSWLLSVGVNVWPPQVVVVITTPLVPSEVFCWSSAALLSRVTLPGVVVRSRLTKTPAWKSDCVVSTRQALAGAADKEKFWIVVALSLTTMFVAAAVTKPALLAEIAG